MPKFKEDPSQQVIFNLPDLPPPSSQFTALGFAKGSSPVSEPIPEAPSVRPPRNRDDVLLDLPDGTTRRLPKKSLR